MTLHPGPRERLFALEHFGIKLGLDTIRVLLEALNRPDRAFPSVHIAGTNGKGSVSAMVERGLRAAGHRTGRYTSPHLVSVEERAAINGVPVDAATFDDATADVLRIVDSLRQQGVLRHSPTFFEVSTAIAFEIFRRRQVTAAVIEVGLGGRFDATNVIAPLVSAITSIDFDHERHLGHTLTAIAFEKAGIIKTGTAVVVGPMQLEPRGVIDNVAQQMGAPVIEAVPADGPPGTPVTLGLHGTHQRNNAAVAVEVLKVCGQKGLGVTREHILSALADVDWPARLEWLRLPAGGDVLIDAAHNPAGARALAEYVLAEVEPLPLVLAVMKDKDVGRMVTLLAPAATRIVATEVASPRALGARDLADRVRALVPSLPLEVQADPMTAVAQCLDEAPQAMVAGSIFLIGPLRGQLLDRGATPVRYPSKASPFFLR